MNQQGIIKLLLTCSSDFKKLYDKIITDLSSAVSVSAKDASTDEFYNIERDCTPSEKTKVQTLLSQYSNALQGLIQQGITRAVLLCADTQDKALKSYTRMEGDEVDAWRKDTSKAFLESRMKRDKGLNLSDRVWNYTQQTKSEFELAMSHALEDGISKGTSAESLGRKVRQYLNNPDMMYRRYHTKRLMSDGTKKDVVEWRKRVIDEDGKVHFVKDDLAKVGTGVYRSARQNALRLTITETNMAYDFANCTRWANEPFVLGLRIRLSDAHPDDDICDELEGDYPKTFMWRGWHPRCMCSISPILMDRKSDEWKKLRAMSDEDYKKYQSPNLVKNVPKQFKQWCDDNKDKLNAAREKGKLPYFVRDNEKVVGEIVGWEEEKPITKKALSSREKILAAAKARHEARTDEQINDILSRWDERKYSIAQRENFRSMEKTWGIKREVSMDFEKANQGRGNINYLKGNAYKVNCQSSVVAHELRLRGFDVTAQPNWKIDDDPNKLSSGTWQCWKNQDGTPMQMPEAFAFKFKGVRMSGTPVKETMQLIEEHTQEVGRYHVSFSWKGRRYGHIVTMERKADGTALWYDPQSGKRDFFDKEYVKKIYYVRAYRVDNLLFDPKWNVVRPLAKEALETSYNEAVANYVRLNGKKPKL